MTVIKTVIQQIFETETYPSEVNKSLKYTDLQIQNDVYKRDIKDTGMGRDWLEDSENRLTEWSYRQQEHSIRCNMATSKKYMENAEAFKAGFGLGVGLVN